MLRSPRAASIVEGHIGGGFVVTPPGDTRKLRFCGLLDTLKAACYRDYSFRKARSAAGTPAALKVRTGLARPSHGRNRGRVVHQQVRVAINAGGVRAVHALYRSMTPQAAALFRSFDLKRLEPVYAEFADYYEQLSLASAIDLMCVRRDPETGRESLVLLEVKTGYDNGFRSGTGPLKAPASLKSKYNNSPLNQAFLQLAFYRKMIERNYPTVRLGSAYVVQLLSSGAVVYHRLPEDIVRASDELLACVAKLRLGRLKRREQKRAAAAAKAPATRPGTPQQRRASGAARRRR